MKNSLITAEAEKAIYVLLKDIASRDKDSESCDFIETLDKQKILDFIEQTRVDVATIFEPLWKPGTEKEPEIVHYVDVIRNASKIIAEKIIELEILEGQLRTSTLTGLPNQRVGIFVIKGLIEKGHPFVWTFFDLDRLKSINLAFGEHVTDRLINAIGKLLKSNIRSNEPDGLNDLVVHRSGDEFWLILNQANIKGGLIASQKLLEKLREKPIVITINEDDFQYLLEQQKVLENAKVKNGGLEDFEEIGLVFVNNAIEQVKTHERNGTFNKRRCNDRQGKVYPIGIPVTASMGCAPYSQQNISEPEKEDIDFNFDRMSSWIKSAEERAKQDGRNCVRGYNGEKYYQLDDAKNPTEI